MQPTTHLNYWVADSNGAVYLKGSILNDSGLYHIHVNVLGIDTSNIEYPESDSPSFDAWLSVGGAHNENLYFDNQNYNVTVVSYYDKVRTFNYDPESGVMSWSIPFRWNLQHIQQQNIFVHEEIRIPKSLIKNMESTSFLPMVDGIALDRSAIAVDPFSFPGIVTLHYMINKPTIEALAEFNNETVQEMSTDYNRNGDSDRTSSMTFSLVINNPHNQTTADLNT